MKNKTYEITINVTQQHVWNIMLGKETYPQWVKGFSENSQFFGEWKQGKEVDFLDPGMGGTRAVLDVVEEPSRVLARHVAVLSKNREIEADGMENWIGTTEEYVLSEQDGATSVKIVMHFHPDYEEMLDGGWNTSLQLLKELCEKK